MQKRSIEKLETIKNLYLGGFNLKDISLEVKTSSMFIKKALLSLGIDYDKEEAIKHKEKLNKILELYNQGKSQLFIEKELCVTRKTIRSLLKINTDIIYRSKSEQHEIRYGTEIDHNAFDVLTPDSLYWIGMLYADGHIEEKGEASIDLTLHTEDIEHLEIFKSFLKSNRNVYTSKNSSCSRFRFNSVRLRDCLVELGFSHNKSTSIIPHALLKESRDFWRGVVDGDGGVYNYKATPQVFLCGTLETIFDFIIFCNTYIFIKDKYPTKCKGKNLYEVHYYGNDAIKVADYLYKESNYKLKRKYEKYLEILNR